MPGDSKRTTFSTVDDTGVPAIISWIRELAQSGVGKRAVHKLELARGYLTSVRDFCEEASMHGDATDHSAHSYNGSFSNLDLVVQPRADAWQHAPRPTTPAGRAPFSSSTELGKFLYDVRAYLIKRISSTHNRSRNSSIWLSRSLKGCELVWEIS